MKALVLFDSVEGHTRKIARAVSSQLESLKYEVSFTNVTDPGYCDPGTFDVVFLCAPVHIGKYPSGFTSYVQNWRSSLAVVPTAFISVSLAIASKNEDEMKEAETFPETLFEQSGWQANAVHHAAGALKFVEYNYFKRWMMKRIAEHEGISVDTSQDYELTDWDALTEFVAGFVKQHK